MCKLFGRLNSSGPMAVNDFFTRASRSISKAAHKAAAAGAVDSFLDQLPPIAALDDVDQVSIKLNDIEQVQDAVKRFAFGKDTNFIPIKFWLRDELNGKTNMLVAEIQPHRGFVVREKKEPHDEYMCVTLPQHSPNVVAKIEHPLGATLYKILKLNQTITGDQPQKAIIAHTNPKAGQKSLELHKVPKMTLQVQNSVSMLFDYHVYKIKSGGVNIAKIRPKAKSADNTYIVEFCEGCKDQESRALALGIGLMLTLTVAYEDLGNLLKQSIIEH